MAESMSTLDATVSRTGAGVAGTVAGGGEGAAADGGVAADGDAGAAGGALCAATPTTNVPKSVRLSPENLLSADIS